MATQRFDEEIRIMKKVLLEMRPAFDGYAGIPQESRLLFHGLSSLDELELMGLLQRSHAFISPGGKEDDKSYKGIVQNSNSVISMSAEGKLISVFGRFRAYLKKKKTTYKWLILSVLRINQIKINEFSVEDFGDFVWRNLFAKTLLPSDKTLVLGKKFKICSTTWSVLHNVGLTSLRYCRDAVYPWVDMRDIDIFVAQTPYPARVRGARLIVRYHDALPIFMPHTIANASRHQASHFNALKTNVENGAYFACVSEATRQALIKVFPEVEMKSRTIHNIVSPQYYKEDSARNEADLIIKTAQRSYRTTNQGSIDEQDSYQYILMVATVEPRKNHEVLLHAWMLLRKSKLGGKNLRWVIVGNLGWDYAGIVEKLEPWVATNDVIMLHNIDANDLRVLYRHASVTVCPSLGEGFDFSGVEAMRSGGLLIASDIPVHREIFGDGALYFDPYDSVSCKDAIAHILNAKMDSKEILQLRSMGEVISGKYLPEYIMPQWLDFIENGCTS